ncbi:MAG: peptidase M22 [Clostridia bacterium]|nr:peptidase M22 [Clostridia bacterium]
MPYYLGIDTSNYTTSASIYDSETGEMLMQKKLLPVKNGECGLRQSDAVFHHVRQLPQVVAELFDGFGGNIAAVGVSSRPRDIEGSYMPCFSVGLGTAEMISKINRIPLFTFSHQSGHIAAALYSAKVTELINKCFLAFHVSGGTTEAVIVEPDEEHIFHTEIAAKTLDLNAGQLIDRVGVMLGFDFPCGKELEKLAVTNTEKLNVKPTLKGADCCLSGVENICRKAYESGRTKEYTAALCLKYAEKTIDKMCGVLLETYGSLPVVFAGGVMSNQIIKKNLTEKYHAYFAEPAYSADNASGTAFLCSIRHQAEK